MAVYSLYRLTHPPGKYLERRDCCLPFIQVNLPSWEYLERRDCCLPFIQANLPSWEVLGKKGSLFDKLAALLRGLLCWLRQSLKEHCQPATSTLPSLHSFRQYKPFCTYLVTGTDFSLLFLTTAEFDVTCI